MPRRAEGGVPAGVRWGPFTLRLPLIHLQLEFPELVQGLVVAGATGLAVVPIYTELFGMPFETAVALLAIQTALIGSAVWVFGDPFCPGWLTPALPLVLAAAQALESQAERVDFVNALVLSVGATFLFFGATGLGRRFLLAAPRVVKASIIFGAGLSAVYGELIPRSGGRPARLDAYTVGILVAVAVTLTLMFSRPLEDWKRRSGWLRGVAALGLAPGFAAGVAAAWLAGEISFQNIGLGAGPLVVWPDFAGLLSGYSVLGRGLPSTADFVRAAPLALAAYVIGCSDIVTGTGILEDAAQSRPRQTIPFDERRTHLSVGLRNALVGLFGGPFFPLEGPLWTGATIVVAERYRQGGERMQSIFSGAAAYVLYGVPALYFVGPYLAVMRPTLDIAFSLTLILTGFACAYVSFAMLDDRIERGIALLTAVSIMRFSILIGVVVGFALTIALLGRRAWAPRGSVSA